ncbi:MAG: SDR family oxidoreductase [Chitinophagaceae bacterium]|nr:SDR family oxidoreductase [Chitinophagaceae bacterium]MCW5929079.1 SDR family oxidoreductase [Chitinophagaceae bacterium]
MFNRFTGKSALVTGAAVGIGKAVAQRILEEGGRVMLVDNNELLLRKTGQEFIDKGYSAAVHAADISKEAEVAAAVHATVSLFGKLDIMVNSAGIVGPTSTNITEYPVDAFDKIYSINLRGSFLVTRYAIEAMERNGYGRILLIASIAGKEGNPGMCGYSSMKAGVTGLVKGVAKEYAQKNILVNGLAPAVIQTPMNADTSPEQLAYMTAKIPMGRMGTVEEVAALSTWIVSDECSFTTGFIFDISGGRATY